MAAKIPQEPALVLEEDPQHLGDGKDDLAMGDIQKECLPHPLAPFLKAFNYWLPMCYFSFLGSAVRLTMMSSIRP